MIYMKVHPVIIKNITKQSNEYNEFITSIHGKILYQQHPYSCSENNKNDNYITYIKFKAEVIWLVLN